MKTSPPNVPWSEIVRRSAIGVAVSDASGQCLATVNEAYARMHGYAIEEMEGRPFIESYAPSFRSELPSILGRIEVEGTLGFDADHIRRDGTVFPVHMDVTRIETEDGYCRVAYCQDISARRQAEDTLEQTTRTLRLLSRANHALVRAEDPHGLVREVEALMDEAGLFRSAHIRLYEGPLDAPEGLAARAVSEGHPLQVASDEGPVRVLVPFRYWKDHLGIIEVLADKAAGEGAVALLEELAADIAFGLDGMQAMERLRQTEKNYRGLVEGIRDGILQIGLDSTVRYANPAMARMLGYPDAAGLTAAVKGPDDLLFDPADLDGIMAKVMRGQTASGEIRFRHQDGHAVWGRTSFALGAREDQLLLEGVVHDVTLEHAHKETMARLTAIVDSSQDAILSKDLEGTILTWNPAAERLYGYKAEEAVGKNVLDLIVPPDRADEVHDILDHIRDGQPTPRLETERIRRDGRRFPVSLTVSPLADEQGQVVGASVIAHDISQRKEAERALQETAVLLKEAQKLARMGNWELDQRTNKLYWSEEIYEIFEIDPERFGASYEAFLEAIHPEDRDRVHEAYTRSLQDRTPYSIQHRLLMPDGRIKYVQEAGKTFYEEGASGPPVRSIGTVQDITEQVEAERAQRALAAKEQEVKRLEEENRMRMEFLNAAAHDLNTPLTPIRLQIAVLKRQAALSEENKKSFDAIERNIRRMQVLIQDLLDAARLQAGRLKLQVGPTPVDSMVRDVVAIFSEQMREARITFTPPEPPPLQVEADPDKVIQVLFNLLSNAIKFTPKGGKVHFGVEPQDHMLRFSVHDTGIGLDGQQQAQLFRPFSRPHEHVKGVATGTGLGLYISKGIIQEHGGDMGVESGGPGRGSTFWFTIPLAGHGTRKKKEGEGEEEGKGG